MKDQNQNEKEKNKKKPRSKNEKKFYLITAIGCATALVAIIVIAIAVGGAGNVNNQEANRGSSSIQAPIDSADGGNETPDDSSGTNKPVVNVPEGMIAPMDAVTVTNDYGFYHNVTLNSYYEHMGMDFTAAAGTEVKAVDDGVIESIYKDDILLGTEIVVDHGNGLKSVYRFVTEKEGLQVGAEVEKGEVIATVAEANGNEYKDGAHLHFEILENGKNVDPALHLTLEEK